MQRWQRAFQVIGLGWYVGTAILLGVLGGVWLDNKLGTSPLFIVSGLIFGTAVAFYGVAKMLLPLVNNKSEEKKES